MKAKHAWCVALLLATGSAWAASETYRFEDSQVTPVPTTAIKYALSGANDQIRARLAWVKKEPATPNFAGHYVLATYGCGTGCTASALVDIKTGTIYRAPFNEALSEDAYGQFGIKQAYRADSTLIYFSNYRYITPGSPDMSQENGVARWNEQAKRFDVLQTRAPYKMPM